jgi:murein DD-endopeptidase MepM/ murein hydrolase activator NlpD
MPISTMVTRLLKVIFVICMASLFLSEPCLSNGEETEPRHLRFQWPLDPVDKWTLSGHNDFSTFSQRHSNFYHTGMDLRSPLYDPQAQVRAGRWREYITPVRAAAEGVVVGIFSTPDTLYRCGGKKLDFSKTYISPSKTVNRGLGNVVVLMHGEEYYSVYAHLDCISPEIQLGDVVERGSIIGKMGSSTDIRRPKGAVPHLHFETKRRMLDDPSEDELLGDTIGGIYWGYTPDLPMGYGFVDPRELIHPFESRRIEPLALRVATSSGYGLNVRSGPGKERALISRLRRGTVVVAVEEAVAQGSTWYKIPLPHAMGEVWGWIAGEDHGCPKGRCVEEFKDAHYSTVLQRVKIERDPDRSIPSLKVYDKLYEVYRDVYLWPGQPFILNGLDGAFPGCPRGYAMVHLPESFNPFVPHTPRNTGWICTEALSKP